ncbi:hypothetical protein VMCG_06992 [Cytospora schulzeri]|uniref:Uncharacterized protein n=1 Tax=Cytospora schulzeri TaxID=448051 RepID=A0A423W444_9PEZI|nr:hypothetical protein VMCG_06992 [Valsa malicola]
MHAAGVSPWSDLTYSYAGRNMEIHRNNSIYKAPWIYRQEFSLIPGPGKHFLLETNGINSKADIFLNGRRVATKESQAGSYGGYTYDITHIADENNAVVVKVYPTDYSQDLVQYFLDWNQAPVDNSTGIWRDMTLKQTGPIALGPLSITTDLAVSKKYLARISLRALARNLENCSVTIQPKAHILRPSQVYERERGDPREGTPNEKRVVQEDVIAEVFDPSTLAVTLPPYASREVKVDCYLPYTASDIWWPQAWGSQPLFQAHLDVWVNNITSDLRKASFGLRQVTSRLNNHKDRIFEINGIPFEVMGAGYAPDLLLRWNATRFTQIAEYLIDIGLNTIRLEGKMEQPELYEICDRLGIMVLPGWECCDKWEAWSYNHDLIPPSPAWSPVDYATANASMRHEAAMLQTHPSVLGFIIGSDIRPDDKATDIYVGGLKASHWDTPIIPSAAKRGYPEGLGPSGMKMDGPYDWVPPNYWYDTKPSGKRMGAAFGFASELGSGVGTPEIGSLLQFMGWQGVEDLWQKPNQTEYHMSPTEIFSTRRTYNNALWHRYGPPTSAYDYLLKAQMMDYEATRAQFEAYSIKWNAKRPATGMIYWMLNNAWPGLRWNLFDFYMRPAGAYFGAKTGNRVEHIAYDYVRNAVYLINHSLDRRGARKIEAEIIDLQGCVLEPTTNASTPTTPSSNTSFAIMSKQRHIFEKYITHHTKPNHSQKLFDIKEVKKLKGVGLLRLVLQDEHDTVLSRNVYWISKSMDKLKWKESEWFYTPVKKYADFTALSKLQTANVSVSARRADNGGRGITVRLENLSQVPAVFIRLDLVAVNYKANKGHYRWNSVVPLKWSDNYVTLWPGEMLNLEVIPMEGAAKPDMLLVSGRNLGESEVPLT